jgi:hypothetical protein
LASCQTALGHIFFLLCHLRAQPAFFQVVVMCSTSDKLRREKKEETQECDGGSSTQPASQLFHDRRTCADAYLSNEIARTIQNVLHTYFVCHHPTFDNLLPFLFPAVHLVSHIFFFFCFRASCQFSSFLSFPPTRTDRHPSFLFSLSTFSS